MLVKFKKSDNVYNVFREDENHFYVRNLDGVIQGMLKTKFEKISRKQEREFKLKRVLNLTDEKIQKEVFEYDITNSKIIVNWSGHYPNLCSGQWSIMIDQMSLPIPECLISTDMGTAGEYSSWHFTEDYDEEWDNYYENGIEEWTKSDNWLRYAIECLEEGYSLKFIGNRDLYSEIFSEISEKDWRSGSCGGCV